MIIPTKNSEKYLERTLKSIRAQTYPEIEIVLVDNFSTDLTPEIARRYVDKFFQKGPERQAQRAYALSQISGEFLLHHACDLVLQPDAIQECVDLIQQGWDGVEIDWIPDETIGFWAKVRKLELMLYINNQQNFRPNFSRADTFRRAGGYDTRVTVAGDDYSTKIAYDRIGAKCIATKSMMLHIGEPKRLGTWVRKDVYYGRSLPAFWRAQGKLGRMTFAPPVRTYWRNRKILLRSGPKMFSAFVLYRSIRYLSGTIGILSEKALILKKGKS